MAESTRTDIAAAKKKMTTKIGGGREIKRLPGHLWEGETVSWLAAGTYSGGTGVIALTDRRLFFLKDGVVKQVSEDFPIDKISSVQWNSGMLTGKVQVFVSGNKAEITGVAKSEGKAIVDEIRGRISMSTTSPAMSTHSLTGSDDVVEQIQQLAGLRDSGILTEAEFSAKKTQLLGI